MNKRLVPLALVRHVTILNDLDVEQRVGFYSLFSVTEEPFVKSGGALLHYQYSTNHWPISGVPSDQWMGFYWKDKKDQVR